MLITTNFNLQFYFIGFDNFHILQYRTDNTSIVNVICSNMLVLH